MVSGFREMAQLQSEPRKQGSEEGVGFWAHIEDASAASGSRCVFLSESIGASR